MSGSFDAEPVVLQYFVDEAGTPTLFGRRGKVLVGQEGCSTYFILGALNAANPSALERDLKRLRIELLADPYLNKVPSMLPERRKTALVFHAKDDPPEVRYRVFQTLMTHDLRFAAVVRDKN